MHQQTIQLDKNRHSNLQIHLGRHATEHGLSFFVVQISTRWPIPRPRLL